VRQRVVGIAELVKEHTLASRFHRLDEFSSILCEQEHGYDMCV